MAFEVYFRIGETAATVLIITAAGIITAAAIKELTKEDEPIPEINPPSIHRFG